MARNSKSARTSKKPKVNLVFDESARKEFLCGFRKRKLERRMKAAEDLKQKLKDERKRIKQENKDSYKNMVVSSRPIPELEQLLNTEREYDDEEGDVSVKIVELASSNIAEKDRFIGQNQPTYPKDENDEDEEESEDEASDEELPGMGLKEVPKTKKNITEDSSHAVKSEGKTKQDIKKILKQQALKKVQKSKAFQMKTRMERFKNVKKSKLKEKLLKKDMGKSKSKKHHKEKFKKGGGKKKGRGGRVPRE